MFKFFIIKKLYVQNMGNNLAYYLDILFEEKLLCLYMLLKKKGKHPNLLNVF